MRSETEYNFKAGELTIISVVSGSEAYRELCELVLSEGVDKGKTVCTYVFSKKEDSIVMDWICKRANVSVYRAEAGILSHIEYVTLQLAKNELKKSEIYCSDNEMLIPVDILAQCRNMEPKNGAVDIIFIESLSLRKQFKADREALEANIGALKRIAKELNVAIVTFALFGKKEAKRLSGEGK